MSLHALITPRRPLRFFAPIVTLMLSMAGPAHAADSTSDLAESTSSSAEPVSTSAEDSASTGSRFEPARIRGGIDALVERVAKPRRKDTEDRTVLCGMIVTTRGRIADWLCDWDLDSKQYYRVLNNALKITRFDPARVDGKAVRAFVQFSFKVKQTDTDPILTFYLHHHHNVKFYGDDYISAQSYVRGNASESVLGYFGKPWILSRVPTSCGRDSLVWLGMRIDQEGGVHDIIELAKERNRPRHCVPAIMEAVQRGQYLPAFHEGQPVESLYVENYRSRGARIIGSLDRCDDARHCEDVAAPGVVASNW